MNVLVIGAGPTGLTLTLALRRHGIATRLIDKLPEPQPWTKALGVQARTLEVMDRFGLADAFLAAGLAIDGISVHLGHDAPLRLDMLPVHPRFPPVIMLPQAESERLLAGANPERGVEFVSLDGTTARLRHPDGRDEFVTPDWIIGCDGPHSTLRHAMGIGFQGKQYPEHLVLADCTVTGLEPGRIHAFPGAPHAGVYFPIPGGAWRAVAMLPSTLPDPAEGSLEPFLREGIGVSDATWWTRFRVSRRQAERVRQGHMVILGDAAHIHSPMGGQGMNLGVQDAFALAHALARPEADQELAVDHWAAERHTIAKRVLRVTDMFTRAITSQSAILAPLRKFGIGMVAGNDRMRSAVIRGVSGMDYPAIPD
jgi:2-polyprenyl-6-methoxyphenol hydroxylase-like FAD-dependent oxidoreductase